MEENFRAVLEELWPVYREYQEQCIVWLELVKADRSAERIRTVYYKISEKKQILDRQVLALKPKFHQDKKEMGWPQQEQSAWIHLLYFTAQSMELRVIELYRCYLILHQKEIFGAEPSEEAKTAESLIAEN